MEKSGQQKEIRERIPSQTANPLPKERLRRLKPYVTVMSVDDNKSEAKKSPSPERITRPREEDEKIAEDSYQEFDPRVEHALGS